jgi:hypothetical protein
LALVIQAIEFMLSLRVLGNGDLIALEADRRGFVANPPQHEPIPEHLEKVSQARIAFYRYMYAYYFYLYILTWLQG